MAKRGGGAIANVTSLAAAPTGKGGGAHKGLVLYGAAAAALNRLTTWWERCVQLVDRLMQYRGSPASPR